MKNNPDLDLMKLSGLRNTKSRSAILDILERSTQPISAEELFIALKEKKVAANLSTVYRALDTLAEKRLVNKLSITGDNRALFELNRMVHRHYLVCLGCKKILAIDGCPLQSYEKKLAEETDYQISGHRLDIYGYCPDCRHKG